MGDSVTAPWRARIPLALFSLFEAAFFVFGPRHRWVELQCVQKLDEWIWIGLAEGDKT